MSSVEGIGIMEGAYFVGRKELVTWLQEFFGFTYTKVEQCASGAAYCQILDAIYPGKVALHRVKFDARHEHEFIHNYKILQAGFDAANLKRMIHVESLTGGSFQNNLEFLQWFKRFFDLQYNPESNYDAPARRKAARRVFNSSRHLRNRASTAASRVPSTPAAPSSRSRVPVSAVSATPMPTTKSRSRCPPESQSRTGLSRASMEKIKEIKQENERLKTELALLKSTAVDLEKERDFYFSKLHRMDSIFQGEDQVTDLSDLVQRLQNILYDDVVSIGEETVPSDTPTISQEEIPSPILPKSLELPLPQLVSKENSANVSNSPLF